MSKSEKCSKLICNVSQDLKVMERSSIIQLTESIDKLQSKDGTALCYSQCVNILLGVSHALQITQNNAPTTKYTVDIPFANEDMSKMIDFLEVFYETHKSINHADVPRLTCCANTQIAHGNTQIHAEKSIYKVSENYPDPDLGTESDSTATKKASKQCYYWSSALEKMERENVQDTNRILNKIHLGEGNATQTHLPISSSISAKNNQKLPSNDIEDLDFQNPSIQELFHIQHIILRLATVLDA